MNSIVMRCLLLGLLLLFMDVVHAQVACPPGEVPYGTGTDDSVCGPDDSQESTQQQARKPPPPRWAARWGAIATDDSSGSFGAATNMSSRSGAQATALADCHSKKGATCKIEIAYDNECAAMVIGDKGHNSGADLTLDKVVQLGMKTCSAAGDTNCHVYYSACSLPVKIQ